MKYNFLLAKTVASPHYRILCHMSKHIRTLFAPTITVSDALSYFLAKAWHIFLVMISRLFLHAQSFRSISWYLVFLSNP